MPASYQVSLIRNLKNVFFCLIMWGIKKKNLKNICYLFQKKINTKKNNQFFKNYYILYAFLALIFFNFW